MKKKRKKVEKRERTAKEQFELDRSNRKYMAKWLAELHEEGDQR